MAPNQIVAQQQSFGGVGPSNSTHGGSFMSPPLDMGGVMNGAQSHSPGSTALASPSLQQPTVQPAVPLTAPNGPGFQQQQLQWTQPRIPRPSITQASQQSSTLQKPASQIHPQASPAGPMNINRTPAQTLSLTTKWMSVVDDSICRTAVKSYRPRFLLGEPEHMAILLDYILEHYPPHAPVPSHIGEKLLRVLDNNERLADAVLEKANLGFLDRALAKRLPSIGGQDLINALARAKRLGYDATDIVDGTTESVIPGFGESPGLPITAPHVSNMSTSATKSPVSSAIKQGGAMSNNKHSGQVPCPKCRRTFPDGAARDYHTIKSICEEKPKSSGLWCDRCGRTFKAQQGLRYHNDMKVCWGSEQARRQSHVPVPQVPGATAAALTQQKPQVPTTPNPNLAAQSPPGIGFRKDKYNDQGFNHLTPEQFQQLDAQMQDAERKYREKIVAVLKETQDPDSLKAIISSIMNSFTTKQCMIRKAFNVKLQEQRPRHEIETERARLLEGCPDSVRNVTKKYIDPTNKRQADSPVLGHSDKRAKTATPPHLSTTSNVAQSYARETPSQEAGTQHEPVVLDGSDDTDSEDNSDSDDKDIPAQLPLRRV